MGLFNIFKKVLDFKSQKAKGAAFLVVLFFIVFYYVWFECRIEVKPDKIAVIVKKTGENLEPDQLIAKEKNIKGIQLEVLPEGRYFKNPYYYSWEMHSVVDIPAGKLGVKTRLYGNNPEHDQIIAKTDEKGIVPEILRPGKYRINPYAYHIALFNAINIRPGHVGVIVSLTGKDILNTELKDEQKNMFIVNKDMKGVTREVLDPGTYYLNPYMYNVVEVNLQSQRFQTSGKDAISFLTVDGFTVTVEGTIEMAIQRNKAALLTHRVGDMDDIIKKIILPRARGFSRIEGSKHPAINFIVGETRQKFQNDLEKHLMQKCIDWGVDIKSVLIRKIIVPDQIAKINRDREVASQEAKKYEQQIEQAKSRAELAKQEMLAEQNKEKVHAETQRIRAVINAEQVKSVEIVKAKKDLDVAKLKYETSVFQADAKILKAEGQKDAVQKDNEARASVLKSQVDAFQTGQNFAKFKLYQKIAPKINSLVTSDGKDGLGAVFSSFVVDGKEVVK